MSALKDLRILIAEDDESLLQIESAILKRRGAIIFEAMNGKEALDILAREAVDLVLSDIQMPVVTGLELLAEIRKVHPHIPVVLFISGQSQIDENESIKRGASGLLAKPIRSKDLIERIEGLLSAGALKVSTAKS